MNDFLERYIFEQQDLRACYVRVEEALQENNSHHDYPPLIQGLLGEFMSACALLSSSLKFDGRLVLQLRAEGPLKLLMAECKHNGETRAYAQYDVEEQGALASIRFRDLHKGVLALTLQPDVGESYQGIVPLDGDTLADCLQHYFRQSEQLESCFVLSAQKGRACGFMLQQLPAQVEKDRLRRQALWEEINALVDTLSMEELMTLSGDDIMYRLFHQHAVRALGKQALRFACSCSREKMENALRSLGREELEQILLEQGQVDISCEFCSNGYLFDQSDVAALFSDKPVVH